MLELNMFLTYISLLSLIVFSSVSGEDFCKTERCPKNKKHIACDNDGQFHKSCPKTARIIDLTEKDREKILELHNQARQKWASGHGKIKVEACRMATMHYDDDLAKLAVLNVKQCDIKHDCSNTKKYSSAGQNLFLTSAQYTLKYNTTELFELATQSWIEEGEKVTDHLFYSVKKVDAIGHFACLMWDMNNAVGCAASFYEGNGGSNMLVACNYAGKAEHYAIKKNNTFPIYETCPRAASNCTTGANSKYSALCSDKEDYDY